MTQDLDTDFHSIIVLPTAIYWPLQHFFSTSYMDYVTSQLLIFFLTRLIELQLFIFLFDDELTFDAAIRLSSLISSWFKKRPTNSKPL